MWFNGMYRHYRSGLTMMSASHKNREMTSKHVIDIANEHAPDSEPVVAPEICTDRATSGPPTSTLSDMDSSKKTFKSSIVIIPPENCWRQIQAIRKVHDKSFDRWMPHVNMVYPFLADTNQGQVFREAAEKLENKLSDLKPFTIRMSTESFHFFRHNKYCTLWLKPEIIPSESRVDHTTTATGEDLSTSENVDPIKYSKTANTDTAMCENTPDDSHHYAALSPAENAKDHGPKRVTEVPEGLESMHGSEPVSKKQLKKQAKAQAKQQRKLEELEKLGESHPDILHLQRALEEEFPVCNDVSNISERGFTPHLSLGQFSPRDVQKFREQFQNEWETIDFLVDNVCLISRADFHDPFHVRHKVPMGGGVNK